MTSVLQATDVLSFNRFMNQADDDRLQYVSYERTTAALGI
jgi:hypothetical protein